MDEIVFCPKCAWIGYSYEKDINSARYMHCCECGTDLVSTHMPISEDKSDIYSHEYYEFRRNIYNNMIEPIGLLDKQSPIFKDYYNQYFGDMEAKCMKEMELLKIKYGAIKKKSANIPHCPICNSTKIQKISMGSKVGSAALFGIFAIGKLNKTFECLDCGYKF